MEKIGGVIARLLAGRGTPPDSGEKDYQAAWEEFVPGETRKHCVVNWRRGRLVITVDNPVTRHRIQMQSETIRREFAARNLPVNEIRIGIR